MTDKDATDPSPESFKDAARRSQAAGIADETAAYENAIEGDDAPASATDDTADR